METKKGSDVKVGRNTELIGVIGGEGDCMHAGRKDWNKVR